MGWIVEEEEVQGKANFLGLSNAMDTMPSQFAWLEKKVD